MVGRSKIPPAVPFPICECPIVGDRSVLYRRGQVRISPPGAVCGQPNYGNLRGMVRLSLRYGPLLSVSKIETEERRDDEHDLRLKVIERFSGQSLPPLQWRLNLQPKLCAGKTLNKSALTPNLVPAPPAPPLKQRWTDGRRERSGTAFAPRPSFGIESKDRSK
jgi:hypothetical protein